MEKWLLRPVEVAELLGVSRSTTYELIARGGLPSLRIGGSLRVPADGLRTWIEAQESPRQGQVPGSTTTQVGIGGLELSNSGRQEG